MALGGISNFDHTVILCEHIDKTRAFYRDIMQFPIEVDTGHWVSFRIGGSLLSLRTRGQWPVCDDGEMTPGTAAVQLAFRVPPPAVEACHTLLLEKGVEILREPTDLPNWRHCTLFFRDPENNIIEIYAEY